MNVHMGIITLRGGSKLRLCHVVKVTNLGTELLTQDLMVAKLTLSPLLQCV